MRVLVVEHSALFRQGLRKLLDSQPDIEMVGEARDGWEAVVETRRLNPDLVILAIDVLHGSDLDHLSKIREEASGTRILVLTSSEREGDVWQVLKCGAQGYVLKNSSPEQLFRTMRSMMKGEIAVPPTVAGRMVQRLVLEGGEMRSSRQQLTQRESDILDLLSTGVSDREIACKLSLSASTVAYHVHIILRKLHLKNRVQAAVFAASRGVNPGACSEEQR